MEDLHFAEVEIYGQKKFSLHGDRQNDVLASVSPRQENAKIIYAADRRVKNGGILCYEICPEKCHTRRLTPHRSGITVALG